MISRSTSLRSFVVLSLIVALLLGAVPLTTGVLAEDLDDPTLAPSVIPGVTTSLTSLAGFAAAPLLRASFSATVGSAAEVASAAASGTSIEVCSFGYPRSRAPLFNASGDTGYETLRASLLDPANFGPGGTVPRAVALRPGVGTLTPTNLAGCSVFFTSVFTTPLSGDEAAALRAAVEAGMALVADADTDGPAVAGMDSLLRALGGSFGSTTACAKSNNGANTAGIDTPITDGPFGDVRQKAFATTLSLSMDKLDRDADIVRCSDALVRYQIPPGALAEGSGLVMLGGDPSGFDLFTKPGASLHNQTNLTVYLNAVAATSGQAPSRDTQPPTVSAPADTVTNTDPGQATAVVSYGPCTASDNSGFVSLVYSQPSGSTFPLGATPVTCTARDASGNAAQAGFTVTVQDQEPPTIAQLADITTVNEAAKTTATITYPAPVASDNAPGAMDKSCTPGTAYAHTFPVGATTVTCTATDAAGNTATASFTVTVCEAHFRSPLDEGMVNTVRSDRTIPVRITIACLGAPKTGLQPTIKLLAGDVSPGSESGATVVETTEPIWAANTDGIMKEDNSGYYYKLGVPSSATAGQLLTVRIRPFGESNPSATMYLVLKVIK